MCPPLAAVRVGWAIGESSHFQHARGFAVTRFFPDGTFHLIWAKKILGQPVVRVDAIACHEIGHIADYGLPRIEAHLAPLLQERRLVLPPESQRERRADCLASLLFAVVVRYDENDVQTLGEGTAPRPERLGW